MTDKATNENGELVGGEAAPADARVPADSKPAEPTDVATAHAEWETARLKRADADHNADKILRARYGKPHQSRNEPGRQIQAATQWAPGTGMVVSADGQRYIAEYYAPLAAEQENARRLRANEREAERDAWDRYLDARRIAAEDDAARLSTLQFDLAKRATFAAEEATKSALSQATMAEKQAGIADRSAIAAATQAQVAETLRWFTGILVVVGVLQAGAAGAQAYVALHPPTNQPPQSTVPGAAVIPNVLPAVGSASPDAATLASDAGSQ